MDAGKPKGSNVLSSFFPLKEKKGSFRIVPFRVAEKNQASTGAHLFQELCPNYQTIAEDPIFPKNIS
jgi:hypothetical protein